MTASLLPDLKIRLLLVDLNDRRQDSLGRLLAARGYAAQITLVTSAPALATALQDAAANAVLCSRDLPGLPLTRIRALIAEGGHELPLIPLGGPGVDAGLVDALEQELSVSRQRSDQRAAMEMLRESENRFRALANNIPGMAFELTRLASGQFAFAYVSDGSEKLLGLKPHELRGGFSRLVDLVEPEDRLALQRALDDSARSLDSLNWEGRARIRSQQKPKWVNFRSSPQTQADGQVHWHGIATDITRSKETEAALRRSREQSAELSSYLEAAKEEERERIARDIHDELGSLLVALKIEVALLAGKLPEKAEALRVKARAIESLLDQAMGTASRVARELRPGILKEFGLQAAIECQAEDFTQRTGIACRFRCEDEGLELDERRSLALFRIVQEALTNIAKHAHASLVVLRLYRDGRHLVVEVRDNGRGISENDINKPRSFGLRGMRERCRSLDGEFIIAASEQGGTHLVLRLPVRQPAAEAVRDEDLQQPLF